MAPVSLFLVIRVLMIATLSTLAQKTDIAASSTPGTNTSSNKTTTVSPPLTGFQHSSIAAILGALAPGTNTLLTGLLQHVTGTGGDYGNQGPMVAILAAVKTVLVRNNVSDICQEDLFRIVEGLQTFKPWAWKMLDATGKPHSNILGDYDRPKFLGDYDQCTGVEVTGTDVNNNTVTYFRGRKCAVIVKLPQLPIIGKVVVSEAVCVSDRCDVFDLRYIINAAQELLFNGTVRYTNFFTHCTVEVTEMTTEAKSVIAVLCIICVLLAMGTLYDVTVVQLRWISTRDFSVTKLANLIDCRKVTDVIQDDPVETEAIKMAANNGDANDEDDVAMTTTMTASRSDSRVDMRDDVAMEVKDRESMVVRLLLAFSVYNNGRKLLSTRQTSEHLGSIHGIRFLSMAWIILAHTYHNAKHYSKNIVKHVAWEKMQQWTFMIVPYAHVAVDSFFLLSGTLVAYLTLRELRRVGGASKMSWLRFYLHRFWRLTPPYMLVLMTATVILPYLSDGPQWSNDSQPMIGKCRESWFANLLYINNYQMAEDMCMPWTWYLANDMQFYIISPLIVLPLFYKFAVGVGVCVGFMAATLITTAVLATMHEYNAQFLVDYVLPPKNRLAFETIYSPSYARMGPYIVGLFVGYLLYRWNCKLPDRPRISAVRRKLVNVCMWLLSIGLCCVIVYAPLNKDMKSTFSKSESVAYLTLSRTVWAAALGWMVFSCACGYGGWVNQLLSWKAFIPLGRLTYCAYLIHPIVQRTFIASTRVPFYFTDYSAIYLYLGHMLMSYGLAFSVSLAFEAPMVGLEKAIFRRTKSADTGS